MLFIFLVSPHHNYYCPAEFARHEPAMPENYNHFMESDKLCELRDKIVNRYRNSVMWTDHLIDRLLAAVGGSDETVIAVSGDHGEEFWEHALPGHGAPRFYNARTQVPLLLCVPGRKPVRHSISSHLDVWPTALDALELDPPIPLAKWSDGVSLLQPPPADRSVVVTGVGFPAAGKTLALLHNGYKLRLQRRGHIDQFKIIKRLSPDDRELSADKTPDEQTWLCRLGTQMRRFLRSQQAATQTAPPVQHKVDARFGDWVRLVGYDLDVRNSALGGNAIVRWVFECLAPVPNDYRLFIHLGAGHPIAFTNLDHVPVDGSQPVARWRPGDFITDEQLTDLPMAVTQGTKLPLTMGMWAPEKDRAKVVAPGFVVREGAAVVGAIESR